MKRYLPITVTIIVLCLFCLFSVSCTASAETEYTHTEKVVTATVVNVEDEVKNLTAKVDRAITATQVANIYTQINSVYLKAIYEEEKKQTELLEQLVEEK